MPAASRLPLYCALPFAHARLQTDFIVPRALLTERNALVQTGGPTTGVNVGVKLVNGAGGIGSAKFVELWEVGGRPTWSAERPMFYEQSQFSGAIVVHDLTNRRSFENMYVWISDVDLPRVDYTALNDVVGVQHSTV